MKRRLLNCKKDLEEIEARMFDIQRHPAPELTGKDLLAITEALSAVQRASAAVCHVEHELRDVPEEAIRLNAVRFIGL